MKHPKDDTLQQFPKEAYPVLEQYKKVANSLEEAQFKKKMNYKKLQQLEKKVSCLELLTSKSNKASIRYQRKLQKLETTQNYATRLLKMKYQSFVEMERSISSKHDQCATQRQKMAYSRKLSQSLFDKIRTERIQRVRAEKQQTSQDYLQKTYEQQIEMKRKAQRVRQQQLRAKQRKKRYEEFKLQQAALNYNQKLQKEYIQYLQRNKYLEEVRGQAISEQKLFRKTQILNKQAAKIQSIYLTGTG